MELFLMVLGGFLAALAFAGTGAAWRYLRRSQYIPFQAENWDDRVKQLLSRAGVDPTPSGVIWVVNYESEDYLARGSAVVRVGVFKREVRAAQKVGYAVLMMKP